MRVRFLHTILVILLTPFAALAQGVCDLTGPGVEIGAFDAILDNPCGGTKVEVINNSGVTGVLYHYNYKGQPISQVSGDSEPEAQLPIIGNKPTKYTILQYGIKNGKPMYACKEVTVRPNSRPVFSYSTCNNDRLEIVIPLVTENDFDYYEINLGNGQPVQTVNSSQLPFSTTQSVSLPLTISVNGFFTNPLLNCIPAPSITIPVKGTSEYIDENYANIDELILNTRGSAEINFRGSYALNGYSLFIKEQTTATYDFGNPIRTNISPGSITVAIPDTTLSYCFKLGRINACGFEESPEMCTIPIFDVTALETNNIVSWSTYPNTISPFDDPAFGRFLNKDQTLIRILNNSETVIPLTPNQNQSNDPVVNCQEEICYRIIMNTEGQLYYYKFEGISISNKVCVDRKKLKSPPLDELFTSVTPGNESLIKFEDNSGWQLNKPYYYLYNKNEDGSFTKTDSVTSISDFLFSGNNPSSESQCFKVGYIDECGSVSDLSPEVCTIFLDFDGTTLHWTPALPFSPGDILSYEIEEIDIPQPPGIPKRADEYSDIPDLSDRENVIQYRIKALDINGHISLSNILEVFPEFKLHKPTAFTPNGDIHNPTFKIFGKKGMISEFRLEIFDRWGERIFFTDNKDFEWDGTINSKQIESGTYSIKIVTHLTNGKVYSLNDVLTILK